MRLRGNNAGKRRRILKQLVSAGFFQPPPIRIIDDINEEEKPEGYQRLFARQTISEKPQAPEGQDVESKN